MFGVELFFVEESDWGGSVEVLLNEIAPRPHNTGYYTQDACAVSQFENHLRAVCGLPLGDTSMAVGAAASKFSFHCFCAFLFVICVLCVCCANHSQYQNTPTSNSFTPPVINVLGAPSGTI